MTDWNTGTFGCFSNCGVSIVTFFLPCVTYAQNAEAAGTCGFCPSLCLFFCPFVNVYIGVKTRMDTREKYGIDGSCLGDCVCFMCCNCCTLVQTKSQLDGIAMGEVIERV